MTCETCTSRPVACQRLIDQLARHARLHGRNNQAHTFTALLYLAVTSGACGWVQPGMRSCQLPSRPAHAFSVEMNYLCTSATIQQNKQYAWKYKKIK